MTPLLLQQHATGTAPAPNSDGKHDVAVPGEMVLCHQSERSVLHQIGSRDDLVPFQVGNRKRFATCSGVAWVDPGHIAVVNTYGGHLRIYSVHGQEGAGPVRLELLHETSDGISYPEDVAVSPDGSLLAITHSMCDGTGVSLHRIDPVTRIPGLPERIHEVRRGSACHGVAFSPDSRHLAFTEIGQPGFVEVVCVAPSSGEPTCRIESPTPLLKPKSIAFSRDGRFAVLAMAPNICPSDGVLDPIGRIGVHSFNAAAGVIAADPLVTYSAGGTALGGVEICTVLPSASGRFHRILAVSQTADQALSFMFDADGSTLTRTGVFVSDLCFPHGIDTSSDGRFVAITNYGDDTLRIARVQRDY